jgi:hypothetical protein
MRANYFSAMRIPQNNLKILDAVVVFDAVPVMNLLIAGKKSSNMLLHHKPMLWNVLVLLFPTLN